MIYRYEEERRILSNQVRESHDDVFKSNSEITIKRITQLIGKLKTVAFKASLWTECREIISRNFLAKCDRVSNELPLNDGTLYNIFTGESRIRTVNDYYTFCVQGHINPEINSIKPDIPPDLDKNGYNPHQMMWRFFYELLSEDEEMTIFFLTSLAIFISGDITDQSFMCCYGDADNAKSDLLKLLVWLFGDSVIPSSDGMFLESGAKQSANTHTSHYDAIKNACLVYVDETKQGGVISTEIIKKITAGVQLANRAPHAKETINFKPTCHVMIVTQHPLLWILPTKLCLNI